MPLHCWCYTLSIFLAAIGFFALWKPQSFNSFLEKFCRNRIAGIILTLIAWVWAGYALWTLPIDFLMPYRKYIPYLVLIGAPMTCVSMANLLPCRALGGILVLYPYNLLLIVRSHPSPWRLLVVSIAYISIIKGITLLLYPWKMRQSLIWLRDKPYLTRIGGAINLILALLLTWLGIGILR